MFPGARWVAVTAVAIGVASVPLVTHALPVRQSDISATRLADRIHRAAALGWSGEVRSLGSLQVPLSGSTFGGVARVLGEQTHLRVWWRAADDWRIDRIRTTGESDLVRDGGLMVRWNYEDNKVNFTPYSPVRLPDDVDVVPASLAARLLAGAHPKELSRLPSQRVAGHDAAGLRLVPSDARSTISRVDVWADQESGLPLRVKVYGEPAGTVPILNTELISLRLKEPGPAKTDFQLAHSLDFSRGVALDEAAGANAFAPFAPPASIAGLPRRGKPEDFGAVGVYGRGPTAVLAIPLRGSTADRLRDQIKRSRDSREAGSSISLEVGPISVLLVNGYRANFLLTGTVTPETLRQAAIDLVRNTRRTE
ncbi:MAG: sigma-E factor regulatory protein RseB domain-containing protein [Marmoricola sp.]